MVVSGGAVHASNATRQSRGGGDGRIQHGGGRFCRGARNGRSDEAGCEHDGRDASATTFHHAVSFDGPDDRHSPRETTGLIAVRM